VFFCSIGAYEKTSGDSRARSLCLKSPSSIFGALGTPAAKPGRAAERAPVLISICPQMPAPGLKYTAHVPAWFTENELSGPQLDPRAMSLSKSSIPYVLCCCWIGEIGKPNNLSKHHVKLARVVRFYLFRQSNRTPHPALWAFVASLSLSLSCTLYFSLYFPVISLFYSTSL